jgi:hypothetical protein
MRLIFTILFFPLFANATTYYVSNTGSDAANGTSTGTAWQTIAKVNSSSFSAGDFILFKKGDSWNERLVPPSSGSAGNVITFGSYGTGANPIFTGFQNLTFTDQGGNIWASTFSNSVKYQNTVYINGAIRAKGRYPNTTFLTASTGSTTSLTGTLTGTPDYTGADIVVKNNAWTVEKSYITSQSTGTLNFTPALTYAFTGGSYFIQNTLSVLDVANEWCYDTTTKVISVYATSLPIGKASSIDTLIYVTSKNYITFDGLSLDGANLAALEVINSDNITFTNGSITNSGADGIHGNTSTDYFTLTNSTINNSWNNALLLTYNTPPVLGENDYATVTGNTINNSGTLFGMGKSAYDTYSAISIYGDKSTIKNNTIKNTGYLGIRFQGDTSVIKYNYIDSFCTVKHDGGGIYTWNLSGWSISTGSKIIGNVITNGVQNISYTGNSAPQIAGIYLDGNTTIVNIDIDSNTVYKTNWAGLLLNYNRYVNVRDNNFIDAASNQVIVWNNGSSTNANIYLVGNSFYSIVADNQFGNTVLSNLNNFTQSLSFFGTIDSNYYYRPITPAVHPYVKKSNVNYFDYPSWAATGYDLNGGGTPTGITSANAVIYINSTSTATVQPLEGTYYNLKGVVFNNLLTLQPFTSEILFKATQDIISNISNRLRIKQKIR